MVPSTALIILCAPLALAQYGGPAPAPTTSTSVAPPATSTDSSSTALQTVTVGQNGALAFSPDSIVAAAGSQLEFIFFPSQHSVVQASFDKPCQPINDTGFFSGEFTTSSGSNTNSFTITVNDTNPIWFFCGFPTHCETGMVGVINPPSDNSQTLDMFKSAAEKVSQTTDPTFGAQGGVIGPVKAASNGAGPSSTSGAPGSATSSASQPGSATEVKGSILWASTLVTIVAAWGVAEVLR